MKKKIKLTKSQKEYIAIAWAKLQQAETEFYRKVEEIEVCMCVLTKINDIEFVTDGGGFFGVGNISKTMPLWQEDLK